MNTFLFNSQITQLYVAASVSMIVYYNGIRRRHHHTRSGIIFPDRSPWRHLYDNGDEASSFLNLTGFTREAFDEMHEFLHGDDHDRIGPGRPRLLNTRDELGVILFYLGSKMRLSESCLIFGCTPSRCSAIIMIALRSLMINNVFCFASTGKIIYACINFPGSWHDSQVATSLIAKVVDNLRNYKICVDQGFPRSGDLLNIFVGPLSRTARRNIPIEDRRAVLQRHNKYVSLRQSSEWGMRALQRTFIRIKSR